MQQNPISIRAFIGASDFQLSRSFYTDLGFEEVPLGPKMSYFKNQNLGFYLQDAYVKDWIENTMIFLEVQNVDHFWNDLTALNLTEKYKTVRILPIQTLDWGKECFVHDPSGVLWHIGQFNK